jgi:hypothetical protein
VTYGKNLANFGLLENPLYGLNGFFTVMLQKIIRNKKKNTMSIGTWGRRFKILNI